MVYEGVRGHLDLPSLTSGCVWGLPRRVVSLAYHVHIPEGGTNTVTMLALSLGHLIFLQGWNGLVASRKEETVLLSPATASTRFQLPVERDFDSLKGREACVVSLVPNFIPYSNLGNKEKWTLGLFGPNLECMLVHDSDSEKVIIG